MSYSSLVRIALAAASLLTLGPYAIGQCSSTAQYTNTLTLGFDGLADLGTNLNAFGASFTGATVLACGASLNCTQFPPYSGRNVIYDSVNGVITATFDQSVTGPVCLVSARITGNRSITMTAFDAANNVLAIESTGGPNYVGVGTPNDLLTVVSNGAPIKTVTMHDGGNTFTVDDFTFASGEYTVVIDPGHGQILGTDGVLHYQRPPSPTFGLFEDNLTLSIASATLSQLAQDGYTAFTTRPGNLAPFAPVGCSDLPSAPYHLCLGDVNTRREYAEKMEADLLVSIHTNGNDATVFGLPIGHLITGTESFYCPRGDTSVFLSADLVTAINAIGPLALGNFSSCPSNVLTSSVFPSGLIEVAYHTNDVKLGETDEERLNDPAYRQNAGKAVAGAIEQFIKDKLETQP